ncbi:hypothetical protein AGLY_004429 [Aphis glycines]|uniref:Gustatory receptor n=1 Tax=Aphis glycines TaxID=307491 RepID=A0A6G0TYJ7_APHGL|nr:hypothetical protein AGLY_004429 [Aphis glycines]
MDEINNAPRKIQWFMPTKFTIFGVLRMMRKAHTTTMLMRYDNQKLSPTVVSKITMGIAIKVKKLITEMNNRYLDFSTKEELHLFYNQLLICSPKFTIFDIFTINNGMITSAMAAGSTYILILVQIHSGKITKKYNISLFVLMTCRMLGITYPIKSDSHYIIVENKTNKSTKYKNTN